MCVNLRILSRLVAGEKLRSVKDQYYAVEDGTTYQSALRYLRRDSREQTCSAIEVRPCRVYTLLRMRLCAVPHRRLRRIDFCRLCVQTLSRVAAANSTSQTVPST